MATVPQVINNGYISSYKAALYNSKKTLFGGGALAAPTSPVTILMVTDGLSWGYNGGAQTAIDLTTVANYLIWISGKFYLEATAITGAGGGSVVPTPPGGLTASRIDFIVSATSYMKTGDSSVTISQFSNVANIDFVRGGGSQSTLSSELTYFSWNRNTLLLTCSPALYEGELIAIIPS